MYTIWYNSTTWKSINMYDKDLTVRNNFWTFYIMFSLDPSDWNRFLSVEKENLCLYSANFTEFICTILHMDKKKYLNSKWLEYLNSDVFRDSNNWLNQIWLYNGEKKTKITITEACSLILNPKTRRLLDTHNGIQSSHYIIIFPKFDYPLCVHFSVPMGTSRVSHFHHDQCHICTHDTSCYTQPATTGSH